MRFRLLSLLLIATTVQSGCQLAEVDASQAPRYQAMIGREFTLKEDLLVFGVKRDLNSKQPDYAVLAAPPGMGGPEIFPLGSKRAGSRFTIVGVAAHKSKMFPGTAYLVRFADGLTVAAGIADIRISDQNGFKFHVPPLSPEAAPQLSERYFEPVTAR